MKKRDEFWKMTKSSKFFYFANRLNYFEKNRPTFNSVENCPSPRGAVCCSEGCESLETIFVILEKSVHVRSAYWAADLT